MKILTKHCFAKIMQQNNFPIEGIITKEKAINYAQELGSVDCLKNRKLDSKFRLKP